MKNIYLLMKRRFFYYDTKDKENVETITIIGYFSSLEKLNVAKSICIDARINPKFLETTEFNVNVSAKNKYVYVLHYEYVIVNDEGLVDSFYYDFEPKALRHDCVIQKRELKKQDKFKPTPFKYFAKTSDGFSVNNRLIDYIYGLPKKFRKQL